MPHLDTLAAPTASESVASAQPEVLHLDRDTAALFAEVEAVLRAALASAYLPPARPAVGCAFLRPRSVGRSCRAPAVRPRRAPAQGVDAMERGPPTSDVPATNNKSRGRKVMASQQT